MNPVDNSDNKKINASEYRSVSAIDARLAEIEKEKQHLLSLKKELKKTQLRASIGSSMSPGQKIEIFRRLFRGRVDVFATRWQNQQGRSSYSVACNNEWVKGICNKPKIKCQDCSHRQFSEFSDQTI